MHETVLLVYCYKMLSLDTICLKELEFLLGIYMHETVLLVYCYKMLSLDTICLSINLTFGHS
jgi:hypothetical protein